jgi:hypothetical protein
MNGPSIEGYISSSSGGGAPLRRFRCLLRPAGSTRRSCPTHRDDAALGLARCPMRVADGLSQGTSRARTATTGPIMAVQSELHIPASRSARRCREKFLDFFPGGFRDPTYVDTERAYKWRAHTSWESHVGPMLRGGRLPPRDHVDVAREAVRIESRTNLLFSFEKMALRDAVSSTIAARQFVDHLAKWLYARGSESERFATWCDAVATMPRRQTRVLTWPVTTVFGFIARPRVHMILKPNVMRRAAEAYGYLPNSETYLSLLRFAREVRHDLRDLRPRDMIDIQSFLWVQGSEEYD